MVCATSPPFFRYLKGFWKKIRIWNYAPKLFLTLSFPNRKIVRIENFIYSDPERDLGEFIFSKIRIIWNSCFSFINFKSGAIASYWIKKRSFFYVWAETTQNSNHDFVFSKNSVFLDFEVRAKRTKHHMLSKGTSWVFIPKRSKNLRISPFWTRWLIKFSPTGKSCWKEYFWECALLTFSRGIFSRPKISQD